MDNKPKGELVELKFQVEAMSRNLIVAKPYGDSMPYDFIVDNGTRLLKIQVKATSYRCERQGCYKVIAAKGSYTKDLYSKKDVDFFACYIIPENTWYIIPIESVTTKSLRLSKSKDFFKNNWDLLK